MIGWIMSWMAKREIAKAKQRIQDAKVRTWRVLLEIEMTYIDKNRYGHICHRYTAKISWIENGIGHRKIKIFRYDTGEYDDLYSYRNTNIIKPLSAQFMNGVNVPTMNDIAARAGVVGDNNTPIRFVEYVQAPIFKDAFDKTVKTYGDYNAE